MTNNIEKLTITINKRNSFYLFLLSLIVISILPIIGILIAILIKPSIVNNLNTFLLPIILEIFFLPLSILLIKSYLRDYYPIYRMTFVIGRERIEIIINNNIYFEELWKNIKKIEIINEKSFSHQAKYLYKINVITDKGFKKFRLYLLRINIKKCRMIIEAIEGIAKIYQVDIESRHQKYLDKHNFYQEMKNERLKIINFKKEKN